jgi:hypothetical protein
MTRTICVQTSHSLSRSYLNHIVLNIQWGFHPMEFVNVLCLTTHSIVHQFTGLGRVESLELRRESIEKCHLIVQGIVFTECLGGYINNRRYWQSPRNLDEVVYCVAS